MIPRASAPLNFPRAPGQWCPKRRTPREGGAPALPSHGECPHQHPLLPKPRRVPSPATALSPTMASLAFALSTGLARVSLPNHGPDQRPLLPKPWGRRSPTPSMSQMLLLPGRHNAVLSALGLSLVRSSTYSGDQSPTCDIQEARESRRPPGIPNSQTALTRIRRRSSRWVLPLEYSFFWGRLRAARVRQCVSAQGRYG